MQLLWFLVATFLPLFFFLFFRRLFPTRNLPPGPTVFHLWRNRSALAKQPHIAIHEVSKSFGPLISFRLGRRLVVVASSPAIAKEIHKTNSLIFCGRVFPSLYYHIPGAVHASFVMAGGCDDNWKFLRSIGQNYIFSSKAIESSSGKRKTKVMEMVNSLVLQRGNIVNIESLIYKTFINIFTNVLVSTNLCNGIDDQKVIDFLNEMIKKASVPGLADMFPILKGMDFWSKREGMGMYSEIKLLWGDIITERRAARRGEHHANSDDDFLDVLISHSFDDDKIRILLTELLGAATESNFVTAVWMIAEFVKNQEILHKVRQEIAEKAVDGNELKESHLSECAYLQACIKETFRVHIPGPFGVPRRATQDCVVNNYAIPKDSTVILNSWAMQRDPNIWEDPANFKPERFLGSKIDYRGAHYEFLPFGAGRRMCPGINPAIRNLQLVVASLVHYFDWGLPHGNDPSHLDTFSDTFGTSLRREKPLYLIPTPR